MYLFEPYPGSTIPPAKPCRPQAGFGPVIMIMVMLVMMVKIVKITKMVKLCAIMTLVRTIKKH